MHVRPELHLLERGLTLARGGAGHRAIDAHRTHAEVAQVGEALQLQPVESVDGQAGALHEDEAQQQREQGPLGQAVRPDGNAREQASGTLP